MRSTWISPLVAAAVLAGPGSALAQHRGGARPPAPSPGQAAQQHRQMLEQQRKYEQQMVEQQRRYEQQQLIEHQRRLAQQQAEHQHRLRQQAEARSRAAQVGASRPNPGGQAVHAAAAGASPTPPPATGSSSARSSKAVALKGRDAGATPGSSATPGGPSAAGLASVPASSKAAAKAAAAPSWDLNDDHFQGFVGWHRHHHGHHRNSQFDSPEAFRSWLAREEQLMLAGKRPDALFRDFLSWPGLAGLGSAQLRHFERMLRYEEALIDGGFGGPAFHAWAARHRDHQAYQNWLREQKYRLQKGQSVDPWYLRLLELEAESRSSGGSR